jgi:hypothetical protein
MISEINKSYKKMIMVQNNHQGFHIGLKKDIYGKTFVRLVKSWIDCTKMFCRGSAIHTFSYVLNILIMYAKTKNLLR